MISSFDFGMLVTANDEDGAETKLTISPDCEPLINEDNQADVV